MKEQQRPEVPFRRHKETIESLGAYGSSAIVATIAPVHVSVEWQIEIAVSTDCAARSK